MTKIIASIAFAFVAFFAVLGMSTTASAAERCGSGAFQGESQTILIQPCPSGSSVSYIAGVPGQDQLIKNGLIALQNRAAPENCLWLKQIRSVRTGDTFRAKQITTDLVALPAAGVLRMTGVIALKSDARIAGIELKPGACKGKTVAVSVPEAIALK